MLKLLVAVDGSAHCLRAIEAVARLAQQTIELQAVLLNVREGPAYYGELPPFDHESIEQAQRQQQEAVLHAALAHARSCGLQRVSAQAVQGMGRRRRSCAYRSRRRSTRSPWAPMAAGRWAPCSWGRWHNACSISPTCRCCW